MRLFAPLVVVSFLCASGTRAQVVNVDTGALVPSVSSDRSVTPEGAPLDESEEGVAVEVRTMRPGERLRLITGYDTTSGVLPLSTGPVYFTQSRPRLMLLCTGNCTLTLRVGADYRFQVPPPPDHHYGIRGMSDSAVVTITDRTIALEVTHNLRPRVRRRSWLTLASMVAIGGVLAGVGVSRRDAWCGDRDCTGMNVHAPLFWTGIALIGITPCLLPIPIILRSRTEVRVIESEQ